MMAINLLCVGNLKEKFSREEQAEYAKRLGAFCKLNIVELKEQNHLQNVDLILEKESEEILQNLKGFCILCDIGAKQFSSENFAAEIEKLSLHNSAITFVVGGSYGVSEKVRAACNARISFSSMTFPHNLFRIMLLEQIYRAFTILNGKSYHK